MAKKKLPKLRPDAAEIAFRVMQAETRQAPKTDPGKRPKDQKAKTTPAMVSGGLTDRVWTVEDLEAWMDLEPLQLASHNCMKG